MTSYIKPTPSSKDKTTVIVISKQEAYKVSQNGHALPSGTRECHQELQLSHSHWQHLWCNEKAENCSRIYSKITREVSLIFRTTPPHTHLPYNNTAMAEGNHYSKNQQFSHSSLDHQVTQRLTMELHQLQYDTCIFSKETVDVTAERTSITQCASACHCVWTKL